MGKWRRGGRGYQKDPGHQAEVRSEEAEKWVWQHPRCGQNHSPGNAPNFKGGLVHKTPSYRALLGGLDTKTIHTEMEGPDP